MNAVKKFLPLLILLLLVYSWYYFFYNNQHPKTQNVLGANANIELFEQPGSGRQPIVDAIDGAKKEILVEVYLLSDKQIISALESAKSRGIDVKVMLEQHPFGGGNYNKKSKAELDSSGVETEWSNPKFALTHEKSIVIDGQIAFILGQNLSATAFTKNREHDVEDVNPGDVSEVRNIFIADWQRTSFSPPSDTSLIESPDNSRAALTTLIDNSTKTIDAETEDINDQQLINLLEQKAKTEKVRLLTPTIGQLAANQQYLKELSDNGVEVETISSPYMHAKMIVSDATKAYVGSINFTTQSMDQNRELGIILTQTDSLQTLEADFEEDWSKGTEFK